MKRTLIMLAAALTAAACTVDTGGSGEPDWGADRATRLASALHQWADAGYSGSIALAADGEVTCRASVGLADITAQALNTVDTVFAIGSVSKAFTAAAVFDFGDAGRLEHDDRAGDLLPGLEGAAAEATVEQLLLHTSGLSGTHGVDHEPLGRDAAIVACSVR